MSIQWECSGNPIGYECHSNCITHKFWTNANYALHSYLLCNLHWCTALQPSRGVVCVQSVVDSSMVEVLCVDVDM